MNFEERNVLSIREHHRNLPFFQTQPEIVFPRLESAGELNYLVRNGFRCFPSAKSQELPRKSPKPHFRVTWGIKPDNDLLSLK